MIRYLVPFYDGNDPEVIPVFFASHFFQGYIAEARIRLDQLEADYYYFIADDMIVNPCINEDNIQDKLNLNGEVLFSRYQELASSKWNLRRISDAIWSFREREDVNYKSELLDADVAFRRAAEKGYNNFTIQRKYHHFGFKHWLKQTSPKTVWNYVRTKKMPYPLMYGYSDWMIIPKREMNIVAPKLGVTAAMGLFVEIAIPTILCLYCDNVRFLDSTNYKKGEIWDKSILNKLCEENDWNLNKLLNAFPTDLLYIHPIKLSKWSM